ncbi:protein phosphatase 2C domain-containing protein [Sphingomonas sp. DG1-23]|uniref:PP2C family protein-serine/threonine phosphatase n=1 Tax=Sphingomonas sp. DG1-23 TaxID=3068316 RepID=UPI00273E7E9D|nr:protein phosphatase 2C domain-containing protein [Sphingomonas sp. DG1-23]MDP5278857.1 protein phosphatase 2C domain-containing protein [Sphingomonas sp. DG1-23]
MACRSLSRSHVGRVRKVNEDRILDRPDRALWAVADGMGGHRGGDIAAELAIAALRGLADDPADITAAAIRDALQRANAEILERGAAAGGVIGSTMVVLHIADGMAHLFWAGDSRAYRAEHGAWYQLTRDHSFVQELIDEGLIASGDAAHHPRAHVITRALGVDAEVELECAALPILGDEIFLLCSDGLSRSLGAETPPDLAELDARVADALLEAALINDGSDNISFVLISADGAAG